MPRCWHVTPLTKSKMANTAKRSHKLKFKSVNWFHPENFTTKFSGFLF